MSTRKKLPARRRYASRRPCARRLLGVSDSRSRSPRRLAVEDLDRGSSTFARRSRPQRCRSISSAVRAPRPDARVATARARGAARSSASAADGSPLSRASPSKAGRRRAPARDRLAAVAGERAPGTSSGSRHRGMLIVVGSPSPSPARGHGADVFFSGSPVCRSPYAEGGPQVTSAARDDLLGVVLSSRDDPDAPPLSAPPRAARRADRLARPRYVSLVSMFLASRLVRPASPRAAGESRQVHCSSRCCVRMADSSSRHVGRRPS